MANLIVDAVPQSQVGEATGMNTIMRTVGGAFGAQIAAAIITNHVEPGTDFPTEGGFTAAFVLGAVSVAVAFAAATLIPGRNSGGRADEAIVGSPRPQPRRAHGPSGSEDQGRRSPLPGTR
jgi:hypothetical protein